MLDLGAIVQAPVASDPFKFLVAHGVLSAVDLAAVRADFPGIALPGLFPLTQLSYGAAFGALIAELRGPAFERLMEKKLGIELSCRPAMITVRGRCHNRDGRIHTDSKAKVATCLLYLNDIWDESGGRLRMLRGNDDLEDYAVEIPPDGGTLAAYLRTDSSWHGHHSHVGQRRCVMLSWMASQAALERELARHNLSAFVKTHLTPWLGPR